MAESIDTEQDEKRVGRFGCVGGILFLIIIGMIPIFGCRLVTTGVLQFGNEDGNFLNFFMLQEPEQEGIGIQWSRSFDDEAICTSNSVRYFMFAGEAENLDYCSCTNEPISRPLPSGCILSE